ncbi:MAG TPA: cyclic nucleotide-binding domain-containing protein [bacterium]|nr:cyclic nucleotide-binding domain-containing protein [bacterium]
MSAADALAVLKKVPLFSMLTADEIRDIVAKTRIVHVEPGTEIFADAAPGDAMYVVIIGEMEIFKPIPTGGTRVLATLESRAVFGEMSLLTDEVRSAGARAKTKCSLLRIDRAAFRERLQANDIVALKMAAHLASVVAARLHAMDDEVVKLLSERSGPDREASTVPLYDIAEARDRVMMQWKVS